MGSAVSEVLMDEGCRNIKFKRIALPDVNATNEYGMGIDAIADAVKELVRN